MKTNNLLRFPVVALSAGLSLAASADTKTDFQWFTGHWCAERDGQFIEELWLEPRGDILLGLSRTVKGAKTASFEFLRIEWVGGVPSYIAQPQGQAPVAFKLTASGATWARFENPSHDFPKRVEYRRTPAGLYAEIAGPGEGGKEMKIPFDYRQCAR
jgi:hypothetical protein